MKRYEEYKPLGVEWIGEIPEHWEEKKLKYRDEVIMGQSPSSDDYNYVGIGLPFIQGNAEFKKLHPEHKLWCETANKVAIADDILVSVRAPIGAVNIADQKIGIGRGLCAIRAKQDIYKFLYYHFLILSEELNSTGTGSTYTAISAEEVKNILLVNPPKSEQIAIANYLDEKTAQIDTLIAQKQKLIELLREERTAIINQAVTKGINPEVKLKPSGIDWLGDIPEHWEVKRMKFYVGYVKGYAFSTELFQPDGMPVIKASDIKNLTIRKGKDFLRPDIVEQFEKVKLKKGDIIISTVGSTPDVVNSAVGQVARVPEEFNGAYLNQNTVKFYSFNDETFADDMLFYNLISNPYRKYLDLYAHGTANQASLNIEDMLNFSVAIPDGHEQRKITEHLKISITNINNTASKIEKEIELLQEYRTALISEVVTGKIKVI